MEKGSILILTLIAVLILSFLVSGLLTVGTTEIHTTQNYYMNKQAYYHAVEGMENVVDDVRYSESPGEISANITVTEGGVTTKKYITGSILDLQAGTPQYISIFQGFNPPPIPNISLGTGMGMVPVVWKVPISSEILQSRKKAYTELESGVYTLMKEY